LDFSFADVTLHDAPERVTAEFKFPGGQLLLNIQIGGRCCDIPSAAAVSA
jgi:hypothetical protein